MISIGNASTVERNTFGKPSRLSHGLPFTVTLSRPFGQDVTIQYATAAGTAIPAASCLSFPRRDFVGTSQTLTIPAYSTSGQLSISVCHEQLAEPGETFFVDLGTPSAGSIGTGRGTGTILNDD